MFNFERTKEVFGYALSLERVRRTDAEVSATGGIKPKDLLVIDNCPSCSIERIIKLHQSRKNKLCSKCFHATPAMMEAKRNQKKEKSEEHKQKMKESHWSKHGRVSTFKGIKHTVYLLVGAPASGKSWVASQLLDKFDYISYDGNSKNNHMELLKAPSTKPKLYDPTFKISTIIRRHSDEFNFILVGIYEEEQVLRNRMDSRGGTWTDTIMKRNEAIKKRYEKYGVGGFLGTSDEVLNHLKNRLE